MDTMDDVQRREKLLEEHRQDIEIRKEITYGSLEVVDDMSSLLAEMRLSKFSDETSELLAREGILLIESYQRRLQEFLEGLERGEILTIKPTEAEKKLCREWSSLWKPHRKRTNPETHFKVLAGRYMMGTDTSREAKGESEIGEAVQKILLKKIEGFDLREKCEMERSGLSESKIREYERTIEEYIERLKFGGDKGLEFYLDYAALITYYMDLPWRVKIIALTEIAKAMGNEQESLCNETFPSELKEMLEEYRTYDFQKPLNVELNDPKEIQIIEAESHLLEEKIKKIMRSIRRKDRLPAVIVVCLEENLYVADGTHRTISHRRCKKPIASVMIRSNQDFIKLMISDLPIHWTIVNCRDWEDFKNSLINFIGHTVEWLHLI